MQSADSANQDTMQLFGFPLPLLNVYDEELAERGPPKTFALPFLFPFARSCAMLIVS